MGKTGLWKDKLPGCFGCSDKKFGRHSADESRAKEMFKEAIDDEASMEQIIYEAEKYLISQKCGRSHIDNELERIRNLNC